MASRRGPDNSVRVSIQGTKNAEQWANIFRAQLATSGTIAQADLDTWLTNFQAAYKTNLGARLHSSVTFSIAKAVLYTPGGGVLNSQVTMTGAGTLAGTEVADNAGSKVCSWLSTVYWRGGKPRTYLPGLVTTDVVNATDLAAAEITALQTAAAAFRTAVNALTAGTITGTVMGFVSFRSGNAERVPAIFFPITGARVHSRLGTQRRRLGRWTA